MHDSRSAELSQHALDSDSAFHLELIKPSHYDDDGYVIQWWRSWIPSNSLASVYGLAAALAKQWREHRGQQLDVRAYDEGNTAVPVEGIIKRIKKGGRGLV